MKQKLLKGSIAIAILLGMSGCTSASLKVQPITAKPLTEEQSIIKFDDNGEFAKIMPPRQDFHNSYLYTALKSQNLKYFNVPQAYGSDAETCIVGNNAKVCYSISLNKDNKYIVSIKSSEIKKNLLSSANLEKVMSEIDKINNELAGTISKNLNLCKDYYYATKGTIKNENFKVVVNDSKGILSEQLKKKIVNVNSSVVNPNLAQFDKGQCFKPQELERIMEKTTSFSYNPRRDTNGLAMSAEGLVDTTNKTNTITIGTILKNYLFDQSFGDNVIVVNAKVNYPIQDKYRPNPSFTRLYVGNKTTSTLKILSLTLYYGDEVYLANMGITLPPMTNDERGVSEYKWSHSSYPGFFDRYIKSKDDSLTVGVAINYEIDGKQKTFFDKRVVKCCD